MTVKELIVEISTLPLEEQEELLEMLTMLLHAEKQGEQAESEKPRRSLLEFEGMGAGLWAGVDAQQYINDLRDEWNQRP